jgi:putative copper resistance protein D
VWDWLVVLAKALTYASTLAAAGGVFFAVYAGALPTPCDTALRRLLVHLSIAGLLAGGAKILLTAASLDGEAAGMIDAGLLRMVWQSGESSAAALRSVGLAAIVWRAHRGRPGAGICLAAAVAATSFAWVGHVHAVAAPTWPTAVLAVHLLCVAFWVGALGPLLLVSRSANLHELERVVARFGALALATVAILVATGSAVLCMLLSGVHDLWLSDYGRLVLVKLCLVALLLSLAAFNRLRLTPALARGEGLASLRVSLWCEIHLALGIFLVTAAFTTLTGPTA